MIRRDNDTLHIDAIDAEKIQPLLDSLRAAGLTIRRVQLMRPTLEDMFIAAVQDHEKLPPSPSGRGRG